MADQPSSNTLAETGNQLIQDNDARFFLASVVNTLQDSVVTINLAGIVTSWSGSSEKLYGYKASEIIGKSLHTVMFPEDFEPLKESIKEIQNGRKVPTYHTLRLHKGGSTMQVEVTLSPVLNAAKTVIGISTVARDVTELFKTKAALTASESRLRAIIEAATDFAIVTLDADGIIIDWNAGAEQMLGHTRAEVIGQHTEIIFTPEDRYAGIPAIEINTARIKGRSLDERWHLHKNGSRFFMSGVMTPLKEGSVKGFVKIARNITDRKLAEEALMVSEERKSLAVHSAQMGEWEWDRGSGKVHISDAVQNLLGLPAESKVVTPRQLIDSVYQPDRTIIQEQVRTAFDGLQILQAEYRIVRADNKEIKWVNTYGRIIAQQDGRPSRMIGVVYDITSRKQLEKHKDDFIGMASHELKTPVTAIKIYNEMLQQNLASSASTKDLGMLQKMHGQVNRLIKLIQSLLDSSTISDGKIHLHPETFDINAAITEQLESYQRLAGNRSINWDSKPIPLLHADSDRIIQVITNFVANAIKYSPENSTISITTEDKLECVLVQVKDDGPGIDQESQPFLFDRYYRVPGENQSRDGFGLGLYISAAIIKQHMGTIGVESTPGKGSAFYFTLPYS